MSEFAPISETEIQQTSERRIFEGLGSRVTIPEKPLVKPSEGVSLRVQPETESLPYFDQNASIENSLKPFLVAIAAARSVFGNQDNPQEYFYWNQWVNVHNLPRFGGQNHLQFEVIGRNARGKTWARPVEYPQAEQYEGATVVEEEMDMLSREVPKNVTAVMSEAKDVVLFDQPDAAEKIKPEEKTLLQFQNYEIMMAKHNPHVNEGGLHLWVHAHTDQNFEGVQSEIKNGVEQFIIASAVAKSIFQELGVPIEIHFSGNWGLIPKDEPGENWQEHLSAHANLYGAPPGEAGVELPPRPTYQRPEMPEETRQKVKAALEQHFLEYVQNLVGEKLESLIMGNNG